MARRYRRRGRGGGGATMGNLTALIAGVVILGVLLLAGNQVLTSVGTTIGNVTGTPFETGLEFLGIDGVAEDGSWSTTGIVGVLGLVAVAAFVIYFIRRSFKGM